MQVPLVDVGRQKQVQRLGLTDVRCPIRGQFHHPALVDLEGGAEHGLFVVVKEIQVLDGTLAGSDRRPHLIGVAAFLLQQFLEVDIPDRKGSREGLVKEGIRRKGLDPGRGAAADDRDRRGRSNGELVRKTFHRAGVSGVGAGALFHGEDARCGISPLTKILENLSVPGLGWGGFEWQSVRLQERVEPHDPETHAAFPLRCIPGVGHGFGRVLDEPFKHVVEEPHDILDEEGVVFPLVVALKVDGRETAGRGSFAIEVIRTGWQCDFRTKVRGADIEAQEPVVFRDGLVHVIDEQHVRLTRFHARGKDPDPERTRRDGPA